MTLATQTSQDGKVVTISIHGRFDFSVHRDFRNAYEKILQPGVVVVVDLGQTEYVDSSALGMLLLLREYAGGDTAAIKLVHGSPEVKKILTIANFHQLFDVV
jgi:anti-anti-sigma factor